MKKKIKTVVLIFIVLVLAFVYAHIAKAIPIYDMDIDVSKYLTTNGLVEELFQQEFVCHEKELDGISIKAKLLDDLDKGEIIYSILDPESDEILRQGVADATKIKNTKFFQLPFKTLKECKEKKYVLRIEMNDESVKKAVGFSYIKGGNAFTIDHQNVKGTLVMKTVTNRFDLETFIMVLCFIAFIVGFMKFLYKLFE